MITQPFLIEQEATLTATLVNRLLNQFNREEIMYSHWKSNIDLAQATAGQIDLDLLVDRKSLPQALAILSDLDFKPALIRRGANPPGIRHYYGFDPDNAHFIHVHLFSRVLTGESYVKSHLFPFEAMLLENVVYSGRMRVTARPAELVLFTLRMFIKYGSLFDLAAIWRKSGHIRTEARWLQDGGDLPETLSLLRNYCPVMGEALFVECLEALSGDSPLLKRLLLARQVRRRLKVYARHTYFQRLLAYGRVLWAETRWRLGTKQKNKVLQAGGAVIAIVGADATGKSTLVAETGRWLGSTFAVKIIHTGKPPSSWLTIPVNIALALVRRLGSRAGRAPGQAATGDANPARHKFKGLSSILYAVRAVTLAWDRQRLLLKSRRRAADGELIICDRYPSMILGAMDSPRLEEEAHKTGPVARIYNRLARLEKRLYRHIPPPDIVLKLRVSLETAKKRNSERNGQDGETYLETRHRQSREWHNPGTGNVYDIDTEQSLAETILSVKKAIWESL